MVFAVKVGVVKLRAVACTVPPVETVYHLKVLPLVPAVPVSVAAVPEQIDFAGAVGSAGIGFTVTTTEARALSHSVVELKLLTK